MLKRALKGMDLAIKINYWKLKMFVCHGTLRQYSSDSAEFIRIFITLFKVSTYNSFILYFIFNSFKEGCPSTS